MKCQALSTDMNFDGLYTVTDLWLQIVWIFTLPGNLAINVILSDARWRTFFEVTPLSCGGAGAAVFSLFAWMFLFSLISTFISERF